MAAGFLSGHCVSAQVRTPTAPATPATPNPQTPNNQIPAGQPPAGGNLTPPNSGTPPAGGNLAPPNSGAPPTGGNLTPPNSEPVTLPGAGGNLPAPGGGNAVIPNSGYSTPPVGGSLNTPPNNLAPGAVPNGNYFRPYGTNGFYQHGTNGFNYLRGTNGFYRQGLQGQPGEFYPDGHMVYQRGPDGLYRWYSLPQYYPPGGYGTPTNGVLISPDHNQLPPPGSNLTIRSQSPL